MIGAIPIAGSLIRKYSLAIFCQSIGALVESGEGTDSAFCKTAAAVGFIPLQTRLMARSSMISRGDPLSDALKNDAPAYVSSLVAAGEASGHLGQTLTRAAILLDRELDQSLKRLTSLVEPVMMICMGSVVGVIALSIMMPIYDISKAIQH
jgi:type II secretory pathway component PulF